MTYLIIDDEPIAHRIIEGYCKDLPHLQKAGNAYNVFEASAILAERPVDFIFLDINMPKMSGFEWLKTLSQPPKIIVATAYREFALESYELEVVDYLLKPFSLGRLLKAINKLGPLESPAETKVTTTGSVDSKRFFLKGDKKHHQINIAELLFVEAYGNYCKVYLRDEMIISHEKISTLAAILQPAGFLRVHKSFLVATDKIKQVQGNIIHLNGHEVPIGQTYRSQVNNLLRGK